MAYRLRVTTQAEEHVRAALVWWVANRPAAPDLLLAELRRGYEIITSEPGVGSPVDDEGYEGVRTLFLDRVGYHIYYRETEGDIVEVLAFWHAHRGRRPIV